MTSGARAKRIADLDDDDLYEDEGGEDWLASFSDMMCDILALFVILYSFALMNQAITAASISTTENTSEAEFEDISPGVALSQEVIAEIKERIERMQSDGAPILELAERIVADPELTAKVELIGMTDYSMIVRIAEPVLFDSGRAAIKTEGVALMRPLTKILEEFEPRIVFVRVEGHTDIRPINTSEFRSNWELSAIRATNVLRWMINEATTLPPNKLHLAGYGEFHPAADNESDAGMAKNRRVDFVIEIN